MYQDVQQYYGEALKTSDDLQTNACCTADSMPEWLKPVLAKIHGEVSSKYYGCGLVVPEKMEGLRVLDLGSGSGRDCYVLSHMVGEDGYVVGVDMTDEQLAVANEHIEYHREAFGYAKANVEFRKGYIEKLDELGLESGSFDLIISNCVINLAMDKAAVLKQAYDLLKPGGEMYFSDVYADRRVPEKLQADPVLYGECLSGALYWHDFLDLAKGAGFLDPRLVEDRILTVDNPELEDRLGNIGFYSATYRLFKLPELETVCEDYGQAVVYKGGITHHEQRLVLDKHHSIEAGRMFLVCGNTWRMLHDTRFVEHFDFYGNWDTHYGIYADCGTAIPFAGAESGVDEGCGC